MITRPAYCTRDDVLRASDVALTAATAREVDRAVCSGADAVDTLLNRVFYPTTGTRSFRWPPQSQQAPAWRLWLDASELISLTALTAGSTTISTANVYLEPQQYGPPYNRLELNIGTATGFSVGTTPQRSIAITGVFGYRADTTTVGTLATAVNASVTTVVVSNGANVGVGDLLICGSEYMLLTESAMVSTSQTLQTPVAADSSVVALAVTTGSAYNVGETLLLDSERMEIVDIAGNALTVTRAVQGTVLASHTGSTIYALRSFTATRGAVGTTAASHSQGDALTRHAPPALISQLNLAYAQVAYEEGQGAYARPGGTGPRTQPQPGAGLPALEAQAWTAFGRVLGGTV